MKLLRATKSKTAKYENSKNLSHSEITEVVFTHCNIVNNGFQQYSRAFNSEFSYTEVQFTDQDKINIT